MDELILQALEFPEILSLLGKRTVTPLGAQAAIALRPAHDQAIVRLQTTLTMEAVRYLRERGALPSGLFRTRPRFSRDWRSARACRPRSRSLNFWP